MKKLILLLLFPACSLKAQLPQWVNTGIDVSFENVVDLENDSAGNLFVTGTFPFTIYFGQSALTSNTTDPNQMYTDIYLVKYHSNGVLAWIRQIGGLQGDNVYDMCIDRLGNVVITGWCESTAAFGSGNGTQNFGPGFFTAKYSGSGNLLSINSTNGSAPYNGVGAFVDTDVSNNLFVGCTEVTPVQYNPSLGNWCIIKKNNSGQTLWKKHPGDAIPNGVLTALATDNMGNCLAAGYSGGYFDSVYLPTGYILAKYNANGTLAWAQKLNMNGNQGICGIGTDAYGNSYVAGYYSDTIGVYPPSTAFLAKYDAGGNQVWLNQTWGGNAYATSVKTDKFGNSFLVGQFRGNIKFGNAADSLHTGINKKDIFIYKIDAAGNTLWSEQMGGNGQLWSFLVSQDDAGNFFMGGIFDTTFTFANTTIAPDPNDCCYFGDVCFIKMKDTSAITQIKSFTDSKTDICIFPNPAHTTFNVALNSRCSCKLSVFLRNSLGEILFSDVQEKFSGRYLKEIDMGTGTKGLLFLEILENGVRTVKKVIVE